MELKTLDLSQMTSQYYSERLGGGVLSDIGKLSKHDLISLGVEQFKSKSISGTARYVSSSGTSGQASIGVYNKEDLDYMVDYIIKQGPKLQETDTVCIRFPYALTLPAFLLEHACQKSGASVVPVSGRTEMTPYFRVIDLLLETKTTLLACNPREAELLYEAYEILKQTRQVQLHHLRGIIVAGEVISPARHAYLSALWEVPIYNLYGATELGNFAYTCSDGQLHVDDQHYVLEYLDDQSTYLPLGASHKTSVYVSSVSNHAMPLLRFELGDYVELSDEVCSCGSGDRLMTVYGREKDQVVISDRNYGLYELQEAIYQLPEVPFGWRLVQKANPQLQMEYNRDIAVDKIAIEKFIYHKLGCTATTLEICFFEESQLFDRGAIFAYGASKKPQYIIGRDAIYLEESVTKIKSMIDGEDFQESIKVCKQLIDQFPDNFEGYLWLGASLGKVIEKASFIEKMRLFPQLSKAINKTLQLAPYSPFGNYLKGILLSKTPQELGGDRSKSLSYLRLSRYLGYASEEQAEQIETLSKNVRKEGACE